MDKEARDAEVLVHYFILHCLWLKLWKANPWVGRLG